MLVFVFIKYIDCNKAPNPFDKHRVKTLQDYKIRQAGPLILRKISIWQFWLSALVFRYITILMTSLLLSE